MLEEGCNQYPNTATFRTWLQDYISIEIALRDHEIARLRKHLEMAHASRDRAIYMLGAKSRFSPSRDRAARSRDCATISRLRNDLEIAQPSRDSARVLHHLAMKSSEWFHSSQASAE